MIGDKALNKALSDAIAREFGTRGCSTCRKQRPVDGGRLITGADGRKRWTCRGCCGKRAFANKGRHA